MDLSFGLFRWLHIIAGFAALFLLWVPIFAKKGGKLHNQSGKIYVWSMGIVSLSAFYMGVYRIYFDSKPDPEQTAFSWFLIFISLLSAASSYYGLRVLRYKKRTERHRHPLDLFVSLLLLFSAIGISLYGFINDFTLITYFPFVGIFVSLTQLAYWFRPPVRRVHWVFEHFSGMFTCCISTVTAFLVFGAPRLLNIESQNMLLWFLPTILFVPLMVGFSIHYSRKYNSSKKNLQG